MKKLVFATAAAVMLAGSPALAQDVAVDADGSVYVMTDLQTSLYDAWTVDQRTAYDGWPDGIKQYYWTLDADQSAGWWMLDDAKRVRIYEMPAAARAGAWTAIAAQMNGNAAMPNANASATVATTPSRTTNMAAAPAAKEYPPCRGDVQDSCVNPREAGLNYGNRPLGYWPGRPASEIDGPLPANPATAD